MSSNGASTQEQQHLRAQLELLQNHEAEQSSASPTAGARDTRDDSARASNGYEDLHYSARDTAARALATKSEVESHIHPDLRAAHEHSPTSPMMQLSHQDHGHSPVSAGSHPSGSPLATNADLNDPMAIDPTDGRKTNKRELSQSKRAAQNRAAQRAFRQRKEGYIKKLEQQVRDFSNMEMTFKQYQSESFALREYIIQLQTRLLDTIGEFPPPPPNVNLGHPQSQQLSTAAQEPQTESTTVGTPLEAVAQAVAGLAAQEQLSAEQRPQYTSNSFKPEPQDDTRSTDEINRHLTTGEQNAP